MEEKLREMTVWDVLDLLVNVWNQEVFIVGNSKITIGKITLGIALLVMGYFLVKRVTRTIENRLLTRLNIEESLRHTLSTLIFYVLLLLLFIFILQLLSIPITVFAFLGGALAIGIGFGSQTIVNNFISGLIIMIERPVRVGDIVEIDGLQGTIEHIGARSTRVKSLDNTHYVVPNSSFLEKNVLNWTLSDDVVRASVVVGVAYGSPTRQVSDLLKQAVSVQSKVLKYPEPLIIFKEFGANSLDFEIYFWTRVNNVMELLGLESEIRFKIDQLFREAEITIAFPQRDVHLDTMKPLQVEVKNL